ncbi:hypothetical protein [Paenibacillus sp. UNC499MF]|uniref:hypothetical protein n=1 Tax=Paenibacillus sp. UNC499MF TaxID=1502751 RepID=UPI00089FBF5C|nr:hypothetical protein [Paenibacillus sp. UNC499MF]SEG66020.1 hypothetical protein SAMN02799616_04069 [Paenibacillus sp. UNC499MF]
MNLQRLSGIMSIHYRNKVLWLYVPGGVLLGNFIVNYVVSRLTGSVEIYTGGLASVFVCLFIGGILTAAQTFPFALGFSVRRTDYYKGTLLMFAGVSVLTALLILLFSLLEVWTGDWGSSLHFFHLPYLSDGSVFEQFVIFLSLLLYNLSAGFGIGSFQRRFGGKGTFILMAALFLMITVTAFLCTANGWWSAIFAWIAGHTAVQLALWLFPFTLIFAAASYFLLRRAST